MAISARRTHLLRVSGLQEILEKMRTKQIKTTPSVYGHDSDYNRTACWGAQSGVHNGGFGTTLPRLAPASSESNIDEAVDLAASTDTDTASVVPKPSMSTRQFKKLTDCLIIPVDEQLSDDDPTDTTIPPLDFSKYTFPTRDEDKHLWLAPNPKAITSRKSLAHMMMSKQVAGLLAEEGLIPCISSPNPRDSTQSVRTPFGPLLDSQHTPCKPGTCYLSSAIYKQYGLKKGIGFNDAWNSDIWQTGCAIFRLAEKNGLPTDGPIEEGMSPLGEVIRIFNGILQKGFFFYGSGGVPVVNGFVSPSANSKAATDATGARDGATFEAAQTVENKVNFTIDQVCERGCPLAMFIAGKALPAKYRDESLPPGEQCMYLGAACVRQCEQEDELTKDDINKMVSFYRPYYELKSSMLRFHLEYRKKYRAVPLVYRQQIYAYIDADKRDDRKPLFMVPYGESYEKLLSTQATEFISEKQMIHDWIKAGGHLEIIDFPFQVTNASGVQEQSIATVVQPRPSSLSRNGPPPNRMAHQSKRRIDFQQHWDIVLRAATAASLRQLEVNVDVSGKIGPLIDSAPSTHTAGSELTNYSHYFGIGSPIPFLSRLGPELQKSPTTHPIRSYDPKVMLLMKCNGGGGMRAQRHGLRWMEEDPARSANLFFHCILVEVLKVQVLAEWSRAFYPGHPGRLPLLTDIPVFLKFIDAILVLSDVNSTNGVLQEQYDISHNFSDKTNFHRFFKYLEAELQPWLARLVVALGRSPSVFEDKDTFHEVVGRLATFISNDAALGSSMCAKAPFQCQHILMNLNEVVDEFPTGVPRLPVVGFGGSYGAQLLQKETFDPSNPAMVETTLSELLEKYNGGSDVDLVILGVKKVAVGVDGKELGVVISINGRPLTTCDVEHGCCITYYYYERKPGCTKGSAKNPKLVFSHCHPIRNACFDDKEAAACVFTFVNEVEAGQWMQSATEVTTAIPEVAKQPVGARNQTTGARNRRQLPSRRKDKSKVVEGSVEELDDIGEERVYASVDMQVDNEHVGDCEPGRRKRKHSGNNLLISYVSGAAVLDEEAQAGGPISEAAETVRERDDSDRIHLNGGVHMENFEEKGRDGELNEQSNEDEAVEKDEDDRAHRQSGKEREGEKVCRNNQKEVDLADDFQYKEQQCPVDVDIDGVESIDAVEGDQDECIKNTRKHESENRNEGALKSHGEFDNKVMCNLMLGMIYGNFVGTAEEIGGMVEHTTQLRRDTARCIATEECTGLDVYTLDIRGAKHQCNDRHIIQDMKKVNLSDEKMEEIRGRVHQICLDHFWFSGFYWESRIQNTFFTKSLPSLQTLLEPHGAIYIGLSVHLLLHLLEGMPQLEHYFVPSLVHESKVEEIDLVRGSHCIPDALYASTNKFGKKDQRPESALMVTYATLQQTCPGTSDFPQILCRLQSLVGDIALEEYRFIRLTNVPR